MENKEISFMELLIEAHIGLKRGGPGSPEITVKALSFIDNLNKDSRIADLGCGTGGQTMTLAEHIKGNITGLDLCPAFIDVFNDNARKQGVQNKVKGIVGAMDNLPFEKEEFDIIWSEGAIDNIGFENGLHYWKDFLKNDGYIAVTSPSWFTENHPAEVEQFWVDAGSGLDTVAHNISVMQKLGFQFVAAFALPEYCWTDNYFTPRTKAEKALLEKYAGNKTALDFAQNNRLEMELYSKYKLHYGYVFYIGKR